VGLEALMEKKTVAEIARQYQVHPAQVSAWKNAVKERLPEVFEKGSTARGEASEAEIAGLEQKIGQLTMELDWLKKKSRQLGI
jgi:putative transposase